MAVQTFLPYITRSNQVLGMLAIPSTNFTGNETTINVGGSLVEGELVGGVNYPLRRVRYQQVSAPIWQDNKQIDYMAVDVPYEDTRNGIYGSTEFLEQTYAMPFSWKTSPGFARYDYTDNFIFAFLQASSTNFIPVPVPPVDPEPGEENPVILKHLSTELTNAPLCSFFEVNWFELFEIESGNLDVASIVVLPPTDDPSNTGALKVFNVQSNPVLATQNSIMFNTLRFVKTANLPVGDYVYPVEFRNTSGLVSSGTLTVTVS